MRTYLLRDVSRWHDTLMCRVETMSYDFRSRSGKLRMFDGDCCDMDGCLRLFQSMCHSHAEGEPCGDDCPVAMLDGQSGVTVSRAGPANHEKSNTGEIYGWPGYHHKSGEHYGDRGGASRYFKRFFYSSKAGRAERMGAEHPTIKPVAVFRYLTRLICPPGGIVLDPFCGSGTIKLAAEPIARKAVGSDKAYQRDAKKRTRQKTLWGI